MHYCLCGSRTPVPALTAATIVPESTTYVIFPTQMPSSRNRTLFPGNINLHGIRWLICLEVSAACFLLQQVTKPLPDKQGSCRHSSWVPNSCRKEAVCTSSWLAEIWRPSACPALCKSKQHNLCADLGKATAEGEEASSLGPKSTSPALPPPPGSAPRMENEYAEPLTLQVSMHQDVKHP